MYTIIKHVTNCCPVDRYNSMFVQQIINNAQSNGLSQIPKQQTESQKYNKTRNTSVGASSFDQYLLTTNQDCQQCLRFLTYSQPKNDRAQENNNKTTTTNL